LANSTIHASVRALLGELIDYAGLFPPASLDMKTAWRNYQEYSSGPYRWLLGKFVVPASRLPELLAVTGKTSGLPLTVLIGSTLDQDLAAAADAGATSVELKASTVTQIRGAAERLPAGITAYFEIPIAGDPAGLVAAIAEVGGRAKVRTGGETADLFPGPRDLGRFMQACAEEQVPFKATAGLHHPVRSLHKLTSEPGSDSIVMHGFLNVFIAAALLRAGEERQKVNRLLEDQSSQSFKFEDGLARWKDEELDIEQIVDARKNLAIGFGSCSFDEPIADLNELGVL
jgi:hypothetical protein